MQPIFPFSVFNGGAGQVVRKESVASSIGNGEMEPNSTLWKTHIPDNLCINLNPESSAWVIKKSLQF
jgi:hypothetical protein